MSRADDPKRDRVPRAMVHRRVLDVAETEPDASIEEIADRVSTASIELVERVLEEYGDPGKTETGGADAVAESAGPEPAEPAGQEDERTEPPMSQNGTRSSETARTDAGETTPEPDELSEKQRATARAVYENPDAPQQEIADALGVTRATVSRRLNDVPGFEWHDRKEFVESLFDGTGGSAEPTGSNGAEATAADAGAETADTGADPDANGDAGTVTDIEKRDADGAPAGSIPPELAHKVVHACMNSDRISEDEELELLRSLLSG